MTRDFAPIPISEVLVHHAATAILGPAYGSATKRKARAAVIVVLETLAVHYGTDYINGGDLQDVATEIRGAEPA